MSCLILIALFCLGVVLLGFWAGLGWIATVLILALLVEETRWSETVKTVAVLLGGVALAWMWS